MDVVYNNKPMTSREDTKFYKLNKVFIRIKHGLFLYTFRNFLAKIGIDIDPYYWVSEASTSYPIPKIKSDTEQFDFGYLSVDDLKKLKSLGFIDPENLIARYDHGLKAVGLKHNDELAAVMSIEYKSFTYGKKVFHLKDDEAYLLNMYTFQNYRGKNLAPYLRHLSYELLKKEGITNIYSITNYFNKSSKRFKEKLKAKPVSLYMKLSLFKRSHKTFKIKDYK